MGQNYRQLRHCAALSVALLVACSKPSVPPEFSEPVPLPLPSGHASEGPRISLGPGGQLALSWMDREELGGTLRYTTLEDGKWQPANNVVTDPDTLPSNLHF